MDLQDGFNLLVVDDRDDFLIDLRQVFGLSHPSEVVRDARIPLLVACEVCFSVHQVVQQRLYRENPYLSGARAAGSDEGKVKRLSDNLDDSIIQEGQRPRWQQTDDDEECPPHLDIIGHEYVTVKEEREKEECLDEEEEEAVDGRNQEGDDKVDSDSKFKDVIDGEFCDRCHKLWQSVELYFIVDKEPPELKKEVEEHQRNRVRENGGDKDVVDIEKHPPFAASIIVCAV
jgi:hypothetical protein